MKKLTIMAFAVLFGCIAHGAYRSIGSGTLPNSWTSNYWGVLDEAGKTGYPIIYIDVNSDTCGHCHTLNSLTLSSAAFRAIENELTVYLVMTDDASRSTAGGTRLYERYQSYYYGGQYPLIAVIASDGSVYGYFNNATTDFRNVASDIRKFVEELSVKQTGQINYTDGTATTPTTPSTVAASAAALPTTVSGWAALLKGRANGVVFDANGLVSGTMMLNTTAKGRVTARVTTLGGKTNIKAELSLDADGRPTFSANGLSMTYYAATSTWVGELNGGKAFASKTSAKGYDGIYTMAAKTSGGVDAGYFTVTAKNGKGRVAGLVNGRNKVSGNGGGLVLPASVVAEHLPAWGSRTDVVLYPFIKAAQKQLGCMVATKTGAAAGDVTAFGSAWTGSGEKWNASTSLTALNGKTLKVGTYEIPVVATTATKIAAGDNAYKARLQAQVRKGTFKGSLRLDSGNLKFEGALLGSGDGLRGFGVSYGTGVYGVTLGSAVEEECSECIAE